MSEGTKKILSKLGKETLTKTELHTLFNAYKNERETLLEKVREAQAEDKITINRLVGNAVARYEKCMVLATLKELSESGEYKKKLAEEKETLDNWRSQGGSYRKEKKKLINESDDLGKSLRASTRKKNSSKKDFITSCKYFEDAHQDFIDSLLSFLRERRSKYEYDLYYSLRYKIFFPPKSGEMVYYNMIVDAEKYIQGYEDKKKKLKSDIENIKQNIERQKKLKKEAAKDQELIRIFGRNEKYYKSEKKSLEKELRRLKVPGKSHIRKIKNNLGLKRYEYLKGYFHQEKLGMKRKKLLLNDEKERIVVHVLEHYSDYISEQNVEKDNVSNAFIEKYQKLYYTSLYNFYNGRENLSLSIILAAVVRPYINIFNKLDYGIVKERASDRIRAFGSYPRHKFGALDLDLNSNIKFRAPIKKELIIPTDITKYHWGSSKNDIIYILQKAIVSPLTKETTPENDLFTKIAYGVGFRRSSELRKYFSAESEAGAAVVADSLLHNELAQKTEGESGESNNVITGSINKKSGSRFIIGLMVRNVWSDEVLSTKLSLIRKKLQSLLEVELRKVLELDDKEAIFQTIDGKDGSSSWRNAIVYKKNTDVTSRDIADETAKLLKTNKKIRELASNLLRELHNFGVRPGLKSGGVNIDYYFTSKNQKPIKIQVRMVHLRKVNVRIGQEVDNNTIVGSSGTTGSSQNTHNHLEITLYIKHSGDKGFLPIANLFPHEIYPNLLKEDKWPIVVIT